MTGMYSMVERRNLQGSHELLIENLSCIASAYGEAAAEEILVELSLRVERIFGLSAHYVAMTPDGVRFFSCTERDVMAVLSATIMPVQAGGTHVVMALRLVPAQDVPPEKPSVQMVSFDAALYRADMAIAARVYEAVFRDRVHFLMQPVESTESAGTLYWECFSSVMDEKGGILAPVVFIPALERLGLTRFFDANMMYWTMDMLRTRQAMSLGCNISALSAVDDAWWSFILADLANEPSLAARLVVEITETASPPDVASACSLIEKLHRLGCRVALDDFGKGFHSVDFARQSHPDFIKIDASFLPRNAEDAAARRLLVRLVALSDVLAEKVVIEGVEDQSGYETAIQSGAAWVQGYHIAVPSTWTGPAQTAASESSRAGR